MKHLINQAKRKLWTWSREGMKKARYAIHFSTSLERRRLAASAQLGQKEQSTLAEVRAEGFAWAQNVVDTDLLQKLQSEADVLIENMGQAARRESKQFSSRLLPKGVQTDSVFVKFALQENILNMASAYFGEAPYLDNVKILVSHGSETESWEASQLWHRDGNDSRILKLWVYLTDVPGADEGPFTYLPGKKSDETKISGGRVSDEAIEDLGMDAQAVPVCGPKSSTFFIDTRRCFHLGSRVKAGHLRVAYLATYVTFTSYTQSQNKIKQTTPPAGRLQALALSRV